MDKDTIDRAATQILDEHHDELSEQATSGFSDVGRGFVLLELSPANGDDDGSPEVEFRHRYYGAEKVDELGLDEEFRDLLEEYEPQEAGVLLYYCPAIEYGAFFDFRLAGVEEDNS